MPDNGHNAIVSLRGGKRLVRCALTSAALLRMMAPAFCAAQIADTPADPRAAEFTGTDTQLVASPESPVGNDAPPARSAPCMEPPPLLRWQDYQGPFQKIVGTFAGKLELKAAHPPHYKPGTVLCLLEVKDKFGLFVRDTFDPVSFLEAAFDAGLDQASNRDPTFGQGSVGYARRFGADFAGQTTWRFFTDFAYPTIFAEEPRCYRMTHGSVYRAARQRQAYVPCFGMDGNRNGYRSQRRLSSGERARPYSRHAGRWLCPRRKHGVRYSAGILAGYRSQAPDAFPRRS